MALKHKTRTKIELIIVGGLILLLLVIATAAIVTQTGESQDLRSRAAPASGLTGGDDLLSIEEDLRLTAPSDSSLEALNSLE